MPQTELYEMLRSQEVQKLRKKCHELTGRWIPYYWETFSDVEEYIEYMKNIIRNTEK